MLKLLKVTQNLRGANICAGASRISARNMRSYDNRDVYEPDYLACMVPDIPLYENVNIEMKGYDYPVLENYQGHIHRFIKVLGLEVDDSFGLPPQKYNVQKYKQGGVAIDCEYKINLYERNIQISDVPSTSYSILLRIIQETTPPSVSVEVSPETEEKFQIRYVPDNKLLSLKKDLEEGNYIIIKKKKRKSQS